MKVTICQLHDLPEQLAQDWQDLIEHIKREQSDMVLLPEMPFYPWLAATDQVSDEEWADAVAAHNAWQGRLAEVGAAVVVGSRPVIDAGEKHNRGFVYDNGRVQLQHDKYYLPNEDGFWEATWYARGLKNFEPVQAGGAMLGFMICTELWFTEHARAYGKQDVDFIVNPRATEKQTNDKWLVGGRAAAVTSGAYCLSSNHCGEYGGVVFGGLGWVIHPDGAVLATTSDEEPFVTVEIDLSVADMAKKTYPRNVLE